MPAFRPELGAWQLFSFVTTPQILVARNRTNAFSDSVTSDIVLIVFEIVLLINNMRQRGRVV